jgi:hypothetical protein
MCLVRQNYNQTTLNNLSENIFRQNVIVHKFSGQTRPVGIWGDRIKYEIKNLKGNILEGPRF